MIACIRCQRSVVLSNGRWIDPEATGDDLIWRETCEENHTDRIGAHEPPDFVRARITIDLWLDVDEATTAHTEALDNLADIMLVQAEDGLWTQGSPDAADEPNELVCHFHTTQIRNVKILED